MIRKKNRPRKSNARIQGGKGESHMKGRGTGGKIYMLLKDVKTPHSKNENRRT